MSDIKNVPGVPGGPGGVNETEQDDYHNQEKGARFRKVARRIREERMEELAARQGQTPKTPTVPGANPPGAQPGGPVPDAQALFSPKIPLHTGSIPPSAPSPPAPSLLAAFRPPPGQPATTTTNPAAPPVFRPTFQGDVANVNTATGAASPLNPMYFATPETADWLINQKLPELGYPGAKIVMRNSGSDGGPFVANKQEIWVQLPDGTEMNAGFLADYYKRNPEDQFPGLADNYLKQIINGEIQAQAGKGIR